MTKQNFDQGEPRESFIMSYAPVLAFIAGVGLLGHYQPFGMDRLIDKLVNGRSKQEEKEVKNDVLYKDYVLGNSGIPMEVYLSYSCPFSKRFFEKVLPQLKDEYVDKGLLKIIIREAPLFTSHPNEYDAILAARAAAEQGRYWQMIKDVFEEQDDWKHDTQAKLILRSKAEDNSLDMKKFNDYVDHSDLACRLMEAKRLGKELLDINSMNLYKVDGIPTFVFPKNGKNIVGAQPYESFKKTIDEILESK